MVFKMSAMGDENELYLLVEGLVNHVLGNETNPSPQLQIPGQPDQGHASSSSLAPSALPQTEWDEMSATDDEIPYPVFDEDYVNSYDNDIDPAAASDLWNNEMNGSSDNLKMMDGTPAEMTRHEPAPAVSSNPAADNVMPNKGAPSASPVIPSGPLHTQPTQDCSAPSQLESAPLYFTNPSLQELISGQGHASLSSWAPPVPPQTELPIPDIPEMAAPQFQRVIDASLPGSSTGVRKRKATNVSNAAKTTKDKKLKKWQLTTPCEDPDEERKRQQAIKAHNDRVKKNNEFKAMEDMISCQRQQIQEQKGTLQLQNETIQELSQKNSLQEQELREEKQKKLTLKHELLRQNQQLMKLNQIVKQFLQQAKLNG